MIDPTQVTTTTTYGSAPSVSTLSGNISLEQAAGRLAVYNNNGVPLTIVDQTGFLTTDGVTSTRINPPGIIQNDGINDRILLGDDSKL